MGERKIDEAIQDDTSSNIKIGDNKMGKDADRKKSVFSKTKQWIIKNKKASIITSCVIGLVIILGVIISIVSNQHDYKIADLSGMTVSEACKTATLHGWRVREPISPDGSWESDAIREIDCENSFAKVSDYDYKESSHSVELKYNAKVDVKGMSVKDGIKLLRDSGWKENGVKLLRCTTKASCGSSGTILTIGSDSYDENEEIFTTYFAYDGVKVFLQTNKEDTPSSSSPSNSPSNNSNSSATEQNSNNASSAQDGLCKSDYQKNLDLAKTAYDTAQKAYDTYKSYGADQAMLDKYQSSLDLAKASLDAVQKVYDTYCK